MRAAANEYEEQSAEGHRHPMSGVSRVARPAVGAQRKAAVAEEVTLVVWGWTSVEPGTLAWVFPSLPSAVTAAHAMRNAIDWAIVRGSRDIDRRIDLVAERVAGAVLVEHRT